jgi:hypothetical protein
MQASCTAFNCLRRDVISRLLGAFSLGTVVPELHVALRIQSTLLEQLALLCEDVFQSDTLVGEDLDKSTVVA